MKFLLQQRWLTSSAALAGGSVVAQLGSLILIPVVSRHFSPSEFGFYASILAAATLLGGIATLRLDTIIQILGNRLEGFRILTLLAFVQLTFSSLGLITLVANYMFGNNEMMLALGYVLLLSGSQSAFLTFRAFTFQGSNFGRAAIAPVIRAFLFPLGAIFLAYQTPVPHYGTASLLIIASFVSDLIALYQLAIGFSSSSFRAMGLQMAIRGWQSLLKQRSWVAANSFFQIVNLFALQAPINMLGLIYGPKEAGWFALSQRLAFAPALFLGFSLTTVVQRKAADQFHSSKSIVKQIGPITAVGFVVLIFGYALLYAISKMGSDKLLGAEWKGAETTFQILIVWAVVFGFSNSLNFLLTLKKLKRTQVRLALARIVGLIGAFAITFQHRLSYELCLVILAFVEISYYLACLAASIFAVWRYENRLAVE